MGKPILVADDNPGVRTVTKEILRVILSDSRLEIDEVASSEDLISKLSQNQERYGLAIINQGFPDGTGTLAIQTLKIMDVKLPPRILHTGYLPEDLPQHDFDFVIYKPSSISTYRANLLTLYDRFS